MLRAQHGVLVEDLERCDRGDAADDGGGGDAGLRERALFTAACWQLRSNEGGSSPSATAEEEEGGRRESEAALELAAVAVAAELTATAAAEAEAAAAAAAEVVAASGLTQKIENALEWEVRRLSRHVCEDRNSQINTILCTGGEVV